MLQRTNPLENCRLEIFNLLIGFEEHEQINRNQIALKRTLKTRRAIEQYKEQKILANHINEFWVDEP